MEQELTIEEINRIADEDIRLSALWCLLTGGEPLLRKDFKKIYMALKRKGLLVTVFTNATLITKDIVEMFKKYPTRSLEVTVYGVTKETYEKVTQKKGSFDTFMKGLNLLLDNGVPVNLKAMALKSNYHEMEAIARFCQERSKAKFRFDPMLHLRYDCDLKRNLEIMAERLNPEEIVALETGDNERFCEMIKKCDNLIFANGSKDDYIFNCGTGKGDFTVSYDGKFKLCSSLCNPALTYVLRTKGNTVKDGFNKLIPLVFSLRSNNKEFIDRCCECTISNLCLCCPAHAWLESGQLDKPIDYFCDVAHARAEALSKAIKI
jgi:radical SAM protein with 4Fe4S-binding SPASM domain